MLLAIGFDIVFGSLFVKTWRIDVIFNQVKLRVRRISSWGLLGVVGLLVLADVIITIIWLLIDKPTVQLQVWLVVLRLSYSMFRRTLCPHSRTFGFVLLSIILYGGYFMLFPRPSF